MKACHPSNQHGLLLFPSPSALPFSLIVLSLPCIMYMGNAILEVTVAKGLFPSLQVFFHPKAPYYLRVSLACQPGADGTASQTTFLVLGIFNSWIFPVLCGWWSISLQNR